MLRRVLTTVAVLLALLGGLLATPAAPAQADTKPLPVPYSFLPNAAFGGMPGANAPGTNDFDCRPTAAHPRPVILLHGILGNRSTNWQTYGPLLKNSGYCVFSLTYGVEYDVTPVNLFGGLDDMRVSARQLKRFVKKVLTATGATKVDLVGHSEGTLMPQWYIKYLGGAKKVENFVGLASAFKGTGVASVSDLVAGVLPDGILPTGCRSCLQFSPTSRFMKKLHEGGMVQPGVRYTSIVTKYDELVLPYTNGTLPGVTNVVLQDVCKQDYSEHFQIASSRNAAQVVLNALDPEHPRPIRCALVLPFVGELIPGLL
jgi:triacylglycerol lipase